jgi:hypothetical protein
VTADQQTAHFTDSDAVGLILFFYWIIAGIWIFFIKDEDNEL